MKVYGHSTVSCCLRLTKFRRVSYFVSFQGFGKADHEESRRILSKVYKDYEIECSDEGY